MLYILKEEQYIGTLRSDWTPISFFKNIKKVRVSRQDFQHWRSYKFLFNILNKLVLITNIQYD